MRLYCLVAGIVPGVERQPSKKLEVDENGLLKLLYRWREQAHKAGQGIESIAVAVEAAVTVSGWPDGSGCGTSRRMSFTHQALRYRVSSGAPRPLVSTPSCSNAAFSAGCGANVITAGWSRSQQSRDEDAGDRTVSARGFERICGSENVGL